MRRTRRRGLFPVPVYHFRAVICFLGGKNGLQLKKLLKSSRSAVLYFFRPVVFGVGWVGRCAFLIRSGEKVCSGRRIRTRYLQLGRLSLCQMSYFRMSDILLNPLERTKSILYGMSETIQTVCTLQDTLFNGCAVKHLITSLFNGRENP